MERAGKRPGKSAGNPPPASSAGARRWRVFSMHIEKWDCVLFFGSRRWRRQTGFGSLRRSKRLGRNRSQHTRSRLGRGSRHRLPRPMFRRARRFAGFVRFFGMRLVRTVCGGRRSRGGMWRTNRTGAKGQHQYEGERPQRNRLVFMAAKGMILSKCRELSACLAKNDGGFYLSRKRIPPIRASQRGEVSFYSSRGAPSAPGSL